MQKNSKDFNLKGDVWGWSLVHLISAIIFTTLWIIWIVWIWPSMQKLNLQNFWESFKSILIIYLLVFFATVFHYVSSICATIFILKKRNDIELAKKTGTFVLISLFIPFLVVVSAALCLIIVIKGQKPINDNYNATKIINNN